MGLRYLLATSVIQAMFTVFKTPEKTLCFKQLFKTTNYASYNPATILPPGIQFYPRLYDLDSSWQRL